MDRLEQETMRRVGRHLIPFLMLCYFFNFLDRTNVSFAALQMNTDLGFSASLFGLGSGIVFFTYMLFETPSNAILVKVGARRWLARIMVTWGLLAAGMAFVWNDVSFLTMRALLGAAEAGFFPGIIFYLTLWFPGTHRARVTGLFMACIPLSAAIGAPFSTSLLYLDGLWGLRGWQWMFIVQGLPSVLLGFATWYYLTERPAEAHWLAPEQRTWLSARLGAEASHKETHLSLGMLETLWNGRVLVLSAIAFFIAAQLLGVGFFLPTIVKGFGLTNMQTGIVAIIPPACGAAAMIWWGRRSDRHMERRFHLAGAMTVGALGIIAAGFLDDPVLKMIAFTVSAMGLNGSLPVFWTLAPAFLTGPSAAVGIAFINSVAAFGAFLAPYMLGLVKDATGSFTGGLYILGAGVLVGVVCVLAFPHARALEHAPDAAEAL